MTSIEWPPGSGDQAEYDDEDLRLARGLLAAAQAGDISAAQAAREVGVFHDLKVMLDARTVELEPLASPDENSVGQFHGPASGAPSTERAAAVLQYPKSGNDRRRVLDFLHDCGARGATDEEIATALGMRHYTAAPRRNELAKAGWVAESGRRRPTTTGTPATVWVLSDAGRAQWVAA